MEVEILETLKFNVTWPTSLRFLERYSKLAECDSTMFSLSSYMLELSFAELSMYKWQPSLLACAALFLTKKIMNKPNTWSSFMAI